MNLEYYGIQKSKDLEAQNKLIKELKEERNQLKYEYLERGREFGNYEGIYKSIRPMFGQRPTTNTKDATFKNYPVDEKSFQFVNLKNLKPLNASKMSELYTELNNLSKDQAYTTDKQFFNRFTDLDYFKNMTQTQELNRIGNRPDGNLIKKVQTDFDNYKSEKVKEREDEIKGYFNKKMEDMNPLEIYKQGINVGQKGKLYLGKLIDIEYPNDKLDDKMQDIVKEYRKLYQ